MGLLKTGLTIGAGGYAANALAKNYQKRQFEHDQQRPQQAYPPYQGPSDHQSRGVYGNSGPVNGHMPYCTGSCGGQCTAHLPVDAGYTHSSYCNGSCGQQCNPSGQQTRAIESASPRPFDAAAWESEKTSARAPPSY